MKLKPNPRFHYQLKRLPTNDILRSISRERIYNWDRQNDGRRRVSIYEWIKCDMEERASEYRFMKVNKVRVERHKDKVVSAHRLSLVIRKMVRGMI